MLRLNQKRLELIALLLQQAGDCHDDLLKQMQSTWGLTFEKLNPHELSLLLSHCLDLVYETIPHAECDESVINLGRKMIQMSVPESLELAELLINCLKERYQG
ncbi:hypothetical protein [Dendronalium sp. ChiSLP03b]|uniref:hypothetical protein n=1 Tax=Dendronalium sp. ChiSLP03b TaxID=3075381 RepID=UPI003918C8CC